MTLQWEEIRPYTSLPADEERLGRLNKWAGIYIWGFKDDKQLFWPYYVGKHSYITYRLCQHLSSLKGGLYTIYSTDELFNEEDKWVYKPEKINRWIDFINGVAFQEQEKHVQNMISRFHYTYALMDDFKNMGSDAEKATLNAIRPSLLINTRFGKPEQPVDIGNLFERIDNQWKA